MQRFVSFRSHRAVRTFVFASSPRSLVAASDTKTRQFWETTPTSADKKPEAGPFTDAPVDGTVASPSLSDATVKANMDGTVASPSLSDATVKAKAVKQKKQPPALVLPVSTKTSHTVHASDIANSVSVMHGLPKSKSKEIVESVFKLVTLTLQEKIPVSLSGFGAFKVGVTKARTARNPRDGSLVEVPEKNRLSFKAFPGLKAALQDGYVPSPPTPRKAAAPAAKK